MQNAEIVADLIILRFVGNGGAQGATNYFGFVRQTHTGVMVSRESGNDSFVSRRDIIKAINAIRTEPTIYDAGPARLHHI